MMSELEFASGSTHRAKQPGGAARQKAIGNGDGDYEATRAENIDVSKLDNLPVITFLSIKETLRQKYALLTSIVKTQTHYKFT